MNIKYIYFFKQIVSEARDFILHLSNLSTEEDKLEETHVFAPVRYLYFLKFFQYFNIFRYFVVLTNVYFKIIFSVPSRSRLSKNKCL